MMITTKNTSFEYLLPADCWHKEVLFRSLGHRLMIVTMSCRTRAKTTDVQLRYRPGLKDCARLDGV